METLTSLRSIAQRPAVVLLASKGHGQESRLDHGRGRLRMIKWGACVRTLGLGELGTSQQ